MKRSILTLPVAAIVMAAALVTVPGGTSALASHLTGNPATYTLDADFDDGTLVNVNHDSPNNDQLQLNGAGEPFNFIWVAASSRGTVVKIDTTTGAILGEYRTTPSSQSGGNPSRTTVDNDGSVWVANRANVWSSYGSVLHIGLEENGQCEDRNGNGTIETSTGLGDIRAWIDTSGPRAVATAADECIVHYTKVNSRGTRHVSVDTNNDVWVGGLELRNFDLLKGGRYDIAGSGTIIRSETSVGYGGYGGLIDGNGVIWSARPLLRWDTALPLTAGNYTGYSHDSYGLCIDSAGNVWNTALDAWPSGQIRKFAPGGTLLGSYAHGNRYAQGCVVDGKDDVWVAHSLVGAQTTVGHLLNDGTFVGNVTVGSGPTGVAVDASGKIWATNYNSSTVSRIDPTAGPIGGGGVPVGAVDLTVNLGTGAWPYNYSDMTGSTLTAPPSTGTWTIVHDSGIPGARWGTVTWNTEPEGATPGDSTLTVTAASSADGITFGPAQAVTNGVDLTVADGQYLKVSVTFTRASTGESPILSDLTIAAVPPEIPVSVDIKPTSCRNPLNVASNGVLPVAILGTDDFDVTDIDPATVTLEGVSPLRWSIEDVATPYDGELVDEFSCSTDGRDGYDDLTLKFDEQSVVAALGAVSDGDVLILTVRGNLTEDAGGTAIVGQDIVVILKKANNGGKKK